MTLAELRKQLREQYVAWTHMKKGDVGSLPRAPSKERKEEMKEILDEERSNLGRMEIIIKKLKNELGDEIYKVEDGR